MNRGRLCEFLEREREQGSEIADVRHHLAARDDPHVQRLLAADDREVESDALIDPDRLAELEDIARDPSFIAELLRGFRADVEGIFIKLERCAESNNRDDVKDLMHTLKGAAVGVGATRLASIAGDIEQNIVHIRFAELATYIAELRGCFDSTVTVLADYVMRQHHVTL